MTSLLVMFSNNLSRKTAVESLEEAKNEEGKLHLEEDGIVNAVEKK